MKKTLKYFIEKIKFHPSKPTEFKPFHSKKMNIIKQVIISMFKFNAELQLIWFALMKSAGFYS